MADNPEGTGDFDPTDEADADEGSTDDGEGVDPTDGTDADVDREPTAGEDAGDGNEPAVDAGDADGADAEDTDSESTDADSEDTDAGATVDAGFEVDRDDGDEPADLGYADLPPPEHPEERDVDDPADDHEFTLDSGGGAEFREAPSGDSDLDEESSESPVLGDSVLDDAGSGAASDAAVEDDGLFGEGPESDEEMPLAEHLEEMVGRLGVVLFIGGVITLTLFPGSDVVNAALGTNYLTSVDVINYLWNAHIPGAPQLPDRRPRIYGPLELLLTELKVAALAGFIVGLPLLVYQTYRFMRPGLYAHERRYYLAAVPTSLLLATVGVLFSHLVVLPIIFQYFTSYTTGTAVVAFGLRETFNLILLLMGYNALIFQIPLFIMLAIMMGLTTRTWMEDRRLLFWGAFAGIAFLINPDPTGMAPIIIVVTMITLFEGTLLLLRWTGN